jgi:hypothetical protein
MPRPPDQPTVVEDSAENRARDETTVGELFEREKSQGRDYQMPEAHFDAVAVVRRIGPQRWAELRRRRDEILAELRRRRDDGG